MALRIRCHPLSLRHARAFVRAAFIAGCALPAACSGAAQPRTQTIFVANAGTASVAAYAPGTSSPATLSVGRYANGSNPYALAYDPVAHRLFVAAGNVVEIFAAPFTGASKPFRVLVEPSTVVAIAVEHHVYADGLLEVAIAGPAAGGLRVYRGRSNYAPPAAGNVARITAGSMIFDAEGHLFVADRSVADGSIASFWPLTGRPYMRRITGFLQGPSALAFDARGVLWAGNYDVDQSRAYVGTIAGIASFVPPGSSEQTTSFPNEGASRGATDSQAYALSFDESGALAILRFADVGVVRPPYDSTSIRVYGCPAASTRCSLSDMTRDSAGDLIVAQRDGCAHGSPGGKVLVFSPALDKDAVPMETIVSGIACPAAVVTGD